VKFVASHSQGRTAAAQCGLFTYKSVPVIFEPPCTWATCFDSIDSSRGPQGLQIQYDNYYVSTGDPTVHLTTL